MKQKDLIKKLKKGGFIFKRHGSNHDVYVRGTEREEIPRHKEIDEQLARAILKEEDWRLRMKKVYPVFLTQTNSVVLVEVPDLEILTEGKDIPDAIEMARDAIELAYVSLEDDGIDIPQPSDITMLNVNTATFANEGKTIVSLVDADPAEYRRKTDTKSVRRNVALPRWLNYEAEKAGINVSRVLQEALMSTLHIENR